MAITIGLFFTIFIVYILGVVSGIVIAYSVRQKIKEVWISEDEIEEAINED